MSEVYFVGKLFVFHYQIQSLLSIIGLQKSDQLLDHGEVTNLCLVLEDAPFCFFGGMFL